MKNFTSHEIRHFCIDLKSHEYKSDQNNNVLSGVFFRISVAETFTVKIVWKNFSVLATYLSDQFAAERIK